jgi:hypothetical protein
MADIGRRPDVATLRRQIDDEQLAAVMTNFAGRSNFGGGVRQGRRRPADVVHAHTVKGYGFALTGRKDYHWG